MKKSEKTYSYDDLIHDVVYHPVRAYFRYPIGRGSRLPYWDEGLQAFVEMIESILACVAVGALLVIRAIIRGPLRPFYKAYLVIKGHFYFKKRDRGNSDANA